MPPASRVCPATGRRVLLSPERANRPLVLSQSKPHERSVVERDKCPFCPGMEHDTPDAVSVWPANGPWQVRVVPNKYPAVRPAGDSGYGLHWVVIEGRCHATHPAELPLADLAQSLVAYRDCLNRAAGDPKLLYAQAFKNVGSEAGASLAHSHSQILATPFVPQELEREFAVAAAAEVCPYCRTAEAEELVVARTENFVAVCPYAPRFGYETWVLPRRHVSRYEAVTVAEATELAGLLQKFSSRLDDVVGDPAYNWVLHTAPLRQELPAYHWRIEILPRTARAAGYEWGTGVFINAVTPEAAADALRLPRG